MEMESASSRCRGCSFLPKELQEKILAWMPFECICTCRRVCSQWNAIFASSEFISTQWAESPANQSPLLVLIPVKARDHCVAYCFYTQTWKKCTSSLFFRQEEPVINHITCEGSAKGLFLVRSEQMVDSKPISATLAVCNPLTGRFFYLPTMWSIRLVMATGIVEGEEKTHKVIVVRKSSRRNKEPIVEIYDFLKKSWKIVGRLPRNVKEVYPHNIVFSEGCFYCITKGTAEQTQVMGFSIRDGSFYFVSLPNVPGAEILPYLIACGSRILAAGIIDSNIITEQNVIIWELEKVNVTLGLNSPSASFSLSWKEMTSMPPSMWQDLWKIIPPAWPKITGVGDYVCFTVRNKLIAYSVSKMSWTWLPQCPFDGNFASV